VFSLAIELFDETEIHWKIAAESNYYAGNWKRD
jgi:hypothetical protein